MALLSAADVASPTFRVPDEVAALGERHEYLLVASAQGADSGQKRVRVYGAGSGACGRLQAEELRGARGFGGHRLRTVRLREIIRVRATNTNGRPWAIRRTLRC